MVDTADTELVVCWERAPQCYIAGDWWCVAEGHGALKHNVLEHSRWPSTAPSTHVHRRAGHFQEAGPRGDDLAAHNVVREQAVQLTPNGHLEGCDGACQLATEWDQAVLLNLLPTHGLTVVQDERSQAGGSARAVMELLHDCVGVGATEPEGADACNKTSVAAHRLGVQREGMGGEQDREVLGINHWVQSIEVEVRGDHRSLQTQDGLNHPRCPGASLLVPDDCLHSPEHQWMDALAPQDGTLCPNLDRVAKGCACAMAFDVCDVERGEACVAESSAKDILL